MWKKEKYFSLKSIFAQEISTIKWFRRINQLSDDEEEEGTNSEKMLFDQAVEFWYSQMGIKASLFAWWNLKKRATFEMENCWTSEIWGGLWSNWGYQKKLNNLLMMINHKKKVL